MAVTVTSVSSLALGGPQSSLERVAMGGTHGDISAPGMFSALMWALRSSEVSGGLARRLMRRCWGVLMGAGRSQSWVVSLFRQPQTLSLKIKLRRAARR